VDQDERVSRLRQSQAVTYGGTAYVVAYTRRVGQLVEVMWSEGATRD
jgi:hypothetical protein